MREFAQRSKNKTDLSQKTFILVDTQTRRYQQKQLMMMLIVRTLDEKVEKRKAEITLKSRIDSVPETD